MLTKRHLAIIRTSLLFLDEGMRRLLLSRVPQIPFGRREWSLDGYFFDEITGALVRFESCDGSDEQLSLVRKVGQYRIL